MPEGTATRMVPGEEQNGLGESHLREAHLAQRGHGSLLSAWLSIRTQVQEVSREADYTELRPLRNCTEASPTVGTLPLCLYLSLVKGAPAPPNNTSLDRGQPSGAHPCPCEAIPRGSAQRPHGCTSGLGHMVHVAFQQPNGIHFLRLLEHSPHTQWLQTTQIRSLPVLWVGSPEWVSQGGRAALLQEALTLPASRSRQHSSPVLLLPATWAGAVGPPHTAISASPFGLPSAFLWLHGAQPANPRSSPHLTGT